MFPIDENLIKVPPFAVPNHWPQIIGTDFGWDHPFGGVRLAWDRDNDTLYVTAAYRQREATPVIHAAAMRHWGTWIPVAWPHDGLAHDKTSGQQLSWHYRETGMNMLAEHATHAAGGFGVEAGITEMLERMKTGRLKVFAILNEWFDEFRLYHREDGLIVKIADDLMSATRIAIMMKRFSKVEPVDEEEWQSSHARHTASNVTGY